MKKDDEIANEKEVYNDLPTPETIQKEFEEFVKGRFGDKVKVFAQTLDSQAEPGPKGKSAKKMGSDEIRRKILSFNKKPVDLKKDLDRFIIKQDEAKKALCTAVCDHYHAVADSLRRSSSADSTPSYAKQNVLILGPTGVGKTYLIRQIAKVIGVPFVKADATRFSETGYVGANADDLIHDLVSQANGDIELAQYGIIYLDEVDKLAGSGKQNGRDVSGRGVQFSLLKLMEETDVDLRAGNDMKSQMQAFMEFQKRGKVEKSLVNTKHILFVVSGAFDGLVEIIKGRLSARDIGFHKESRSHDLNEAGWLEKASTVDFVEYGFEPEFIGRLPVRVSCEELSEEDLFSILKNSEGSILGQYRKSFEAYGIVLSADDEALRYLAKQAAKEKTGARALWTIFEKILRDFKFHLPSTTIKKLHIDIDLAKNPKETLDHMLSNAPIFDEKDLRGEIASFAESFYLDHGMSLEFTEGAANKLVSLLGSDPSNLKDACSRHFYGYEYGLKLVEQNSGRKSFILDELAVSEPKTTLEAWIKDSYKKRDDPLKTLN